MGRTGPALHLGNAVGVEPYRACVRLAAENHAVASREEPHVAGVGFDPDDVTDRIRMA